VSSSASLVTPGWRSTRFSARLSGRVARDTAPELLLRRSVHRLGGRYRLRGMVIGRSRPDLLFGTARLAVFVDGCFWHGCPVHGRTTFTGPNAKRWIEKIHKNRLRDRRTVLAAREIGWRALRVWECEVRARPGAAARRVLRLAAENSQARRARRGQTRQSPSR
jgi:DNA mismatch endonuclease, patch repair protein